MSAPSLEVILTGTGTPVPTPGRAGPGALVRSGDIELQFDVGRATSLRLSELHTGPGRLAAVFLTHHHSDHLVELDDLIMTSWITNRPQPPIVVPEGPTARFARRLLDNWAEDLEVRKQHSGRPAMPVLDVQAFEASTTAAVVWRKGDVEVSAVAVRHQPIEPAVAYKVQTPAGVVVISGDTRVCPEVEDLARGADVLVHEACRQSLVAQSGFGHAASYHADTVELGGLAARAGVRTLVLTHLIPAPADDDDAKGFVDDVRRGGYEGEVVVGADLDRVTVGATRTDEEA